VVVEVLVHVDVGMDGFDSFRTSYMLKLFTLLSLEL
jgi:hypothetical protein